MVHFGGGRIGIAWSDQTLKEIGFRYHVDGETETNWSAKEIIDSGLGPRGLGSVADNHLSMKATSDGRVFLAVKDRDNDGTPAHRNEAQLWLYRRSGEGVWGSKTRIELGLAQYPTQPILLLDEGQNLAYVIFHSSSPVTEQNLITYSHLDTPLFTNPCEFSNTPSSNLTSTKQNLTIASGLMAALSTGTNTLIFRRVALLTLNIFKCDVAPRPNGSNNGILTISDWVQMGRFAAGLDTPNPGNEFQRADVNNNGLITIADWVQCGRYVARLDPLPGGGLQKPQDLK
jgi:hypothetical protein